MQDEIHVNRLLLWLLLVGFIIPPGECQLGKLKLTKPRVGTSKFSLNPLKPLMKLVRDPLKASAQRHYSRYLPPPPGMFQHSAPSTNSHQASPPRASTSMASSPWQRYYSSSNSKLLPPSSVSLMPPMTAMPSSLIYSTFPSDRNYKSPNYPFFSSLPSDIQIKTLRLPSRYRKPSLSTGNINLADSVVRQILDIPNADSLPSVLVIEDPDVSATPAAASTNMDFFSDSISTAPKQPTILVAPPINAGDLSDTSADLSLPTNNNPDVFVIVSKNSKNSKGLFADEKKSDILSSSASSPKMKKYKISSGMDELGNSGSRQVWIIKR